MSEVASPEFLMRADETSSRPNNLQTSIPKILASKLARDFGGVGVVVGARRLFKRKTGDTNKTNQLKSTSGMGTKSAITTIVVAIRCDDDDKIAMNK